MKKIAGAAVAVLIAGCATQPTPPTRGQYLDQTTRTYAAPKETVIAAAEQVLRLADGDDFKIAHQADGFTAQRPWLIYIVLAAARGTDYWSVKATESDGLTRVEVNVGTVAQTIAPMGTSSPNVWTATTLPANATQVLEPRLYALFYSRLDYMLGYAPAWTPCGALDKTVPGNDEALCNSFNVTDATPVAPMVGGR